MWKYEWMKLKRNPVLYLIFLIFFLINAVFLIRQVSEYNEEIRCFPQDLNLIYEELEKVPKSDQFAWLEREIEASKGFLPNRKNALEAVQQHVQNVIYYEDYLENVVEQAETISVSNLFAQNGDYSKSSASMIVSEYEKLEGLDLEPVNSLGFLLATESEITNWCLCFFIILFVYYVIGIEREEGTAAFVRTMKWGGWKTGLVKSMVILGVTFVEWSLYKSIYPDSGFGMLKACNIFTYLHTEKLFQNFSCVNLFGHPVSMGMAVFIAGTVLFLLLNVINVQSFEYVSRHEYYQNSKGQKYTFDNGWKWKSHLFFWEGKKIFLVHKAGILIGVYFLFMFFFLYNQSIWFSEEELYYKYYARQLEGTVTEEKRAYLSEEENRLIGEKFNSEQMRAFERVLTQIERIGDEGLFVDETAYPDLLDRTLWCVENGILFFVISISFFGVFVDEKTTGMNLILESVYLGQKKVSRRKRWILYITVIVLCGITDWMVLGYIIVEHNICNLQVPLMYIPGFEFLSGISVLSLLVIRSMMRVMICILYLWCIEKISSKSDNSVAVYTGAAGCGVVIFAFLVFISKIM